MDEAQMPCQLQVASPQPGAVVVVAPDRALSDEQAEHIRQVVGSAFDGHRVLVLPYGVRLVPYSERLEAIEQKLDTLIQALAADEEEEPSFTLDGQPTGGARAEGLSLG